MPKKELTGIPLPDGEDQVFHFEISDEKREELFKKARENQMHGDWTQQGQWITCGRCELQHGFTVKTDVRLLGDDDNGMPRFGNFNV